jgi:hypothetical protein
MPTFKGSITLRLLDADGNPWRNGLVSVYDVGTTDLATLHRERTGTLARANPGRTDDHGSFTFYATAGRYDISYAGFSLDDVPVFPDGDETADAIDEVGGDLVIDSLALTGATAGADVLTTDVTSDAAKRLVVDADGKHIWGNGTDAGDVTLYRSGVAELRLDANLLVTGLAEFVQQAVFTAGYQAIPVAVIATADGLTTGLIPATARYVTATNATDANDIITLPAPVVGHKITVFAEEAVECRTIDGSARTINGVDSDGTNEAALPVGSITHFTAVSATAYIAEHWISDGTPTKLVPDSAA